MTSSSALVTGATSGLGLGLAEALTERGWSIVAHGRPGRRRSPPPCGGARWAWAVLGELAQVAGLAERLAHDPPHVIVNNAGVGYGPPGQTRQCSQDGIELRFAVNYLAPVLLTELLRARGARPPQLVLNIGSTNHAGFDLNDVALTRGYSGAQAYRQSKCALAAYSVDLASDLAWGPAQPTVYLHPGSRMNTKIVTDSGVTPTGDLAAGVAAALEVILGDPSRYRGPGVIRDPHGPVAPAPEVNHPPFRAQLADYTCELLAPFLPATSRTGATP